MIDDKRTARKFSTLRLSVTSYCNLSCLYCNPAGDRFGRKDVKPAEFYTDLVKKIHQINPLQKVRITGGEPTFYPFLVSIVKDLKMIGIPEVHMTTNGIRLGRLAGSLRSAGLDGINVSVDSIDPQTFQKLSGSNQLPLVLSGIEDAVESGLKVKINCTVMRNINSSQLFSIFNYFDLRGIPVRFLELMRMGPVAASHERDLFSEKEIIESLGRGEPILPLGRAVSGTANYYRTLDGRSFGVIANHSNSFCSDCDRLRMDHTGQLFGCLTSRRPYDVSEDREELSRNLASALDQKQREFSGEELVHMMRIGG